MLKDIDQFKMLEFGVAMVPLRSDGSTEPLDWECYLINLRSEPIRQVLVTSSGYKKTEDDEMKSSTLRYFFDKIDGEQAVMLELIPSELVELTNEFWVSFSFEGHMYDKRYLFVQGSIDQAHLTLLPVLNKKGVVIL